MKESRGNESSQELIIAKCDELSTGLTKALMDVGVEPLSALRDQVRGAINHTLPNRQTVLTLTADQSRNLELCVMLGLTLAALRQAEEALEKMQST